MPGLRGWPHITRVPSTTTSAPLPLRPCGPSQDEEFHLGGSVPTARWLLAPTQKNSRTPIYRFESACDLEQGQMLEPGRWDWLGPDVRTARWRNRGTESLAQRPSG